MSFHQPQHADRDHLDRRSGAHPAAVRCAVLPAADRAVHAAGEPEITIKATGYQWYWGYEYQGEEGEDVSFDALLLLDEDRADYGKEDKAVYPRLLAVDNEIVVPVNTTVRLLVTAGDVLHSWAMPAFGVKMDAVPGRLNETWFNVAEEGIDRRRQAHVQRVHDRRTA
jgi:cytochrome c oxidase subunit 2